MFSAFIVLVLIGTASAVPNHISRIVGGEVTTIEEYPFMGSMQRGYFGIIFYPMCGGTLVTLTSVLSAAHCFTGDSPNQWRVRLGSSQASSGGTNHIVSQIIIHENYHEFLLWNDIAVVRLATAATLSNTVMTARIAGGNYNLPDGTTVYAAGWGRIAPGGPTSDVLQHVDTTLINHSICTARYADLRTQPGFENWPNVTPEMICAGILDVGGKNACQYDVGGPLIHQRDVIVGIISWGFSCADAYYPGVNVRISAYTNWIISNT